MGGSISCLFTLPRPVFEALWALLAFLQQEIARVGAAPSPATTNTDAGTFKIRLCDQGLATPCRLLGGAETKVV